MYTLYVFKLALMSKCSILDVLLKLVHEPNPAEHIHTSAKEIYTHELQDCNEVIANFESYRL